jgi:murein DD-endopeptidase MepM/ murein hydrolase activator NlpD
MDKQVRDVKRQMAYMEGYTGRSYAQAASRNGFNTLMMQMASAEPSVRQSRMAQGDSESSIGVVAASLVDRAAESGSDNAATTGQNSVVKRIADLEGRLTDIQKQQVALLGELRDSAGSQIEKYQRVIAMTGLNPDDVADQVGTKSKNGVGGPLLLAPELRAAAINGASDEFEKQFTEIAHSYGKLDNLTTALSRLPLVTPVATGQYRSTSGFGYRVDPFTGRFAYHSGADMAGEGGTPILASAPGRVMAAERRGPYGNMVEIDHGRGIRTRYGHLQHVFVKPGDIVHFRQKIATMGSTGRSTGPHLHYEIWFNNVVRDPTKFFDAGRNVYKG